MTDSIQNELYDVVAVRIDTGVRRVLASGETAANAEAIIKMAVARRGVDEEFYKASAPCQRRR